jgi:hypothetical protein
VVVAAIRIAYDAVIEKADPQGAARHLKLFDQLMDVLRRSANPDVRAFRGKSDDIDAAARQAAHLARARDWRIG